jgi:hypothetical protein
MTVLILGWCILHWWQWLTGDRPDLSSERASHRDNTATFRQKTISRHKFQSEVDTKTYWLTVSRNMTLTVTLTWKTIETKAFRAFVRTCSLFKSEHLSANIKLTFYKALIISMTYASPDWEFVANPICWNCSACKTRLSAPLAIFQGAHLSENYITLSIFRTFTIILQNYAGNSRSYTKSSNFVCPQYRARRSPIQKT